MSNAKNDEGFSPLVQKTYHEDGSIATVLDRDKLIQYDKTGHVMFIEKIDQNTKVTYRNGQVAAIMRSSGLLISGQKEVSLYDDKGQVSSTITLNKNDQVNFKDGYLSSVIKYIEDPLHANGIIETQYGKNGKIASVVQKAEVSSGLIGMGSNLWVTTSATTYHENGKVASVVTYKQKHSHQGGLLDSLQAGEADSYPSSIEQYDENGRRVISVSLTEKDEVNFMKDKISSITRRDEGGKALSTTTYDDKGNIVNVTNYDKETNKIMSSVDYDNGRPVKALQEGNNNYQDIFNQKKNTYSVLPEAAQHEEKIYTADDLAFEPRWKEPWKINDAEIATQTLANGWTISVFKFDPNDRVTDDDYEIAILDKNGEICKTDICERVLPIHDKDALNKIIKKAQSLDENGKLPQEELKQKETKEIAPEPDNMREKVYIAKINIAKKASEISVNEAEESLNAFQIWAKNSNNTPLILNVMATVTCEIAENYPELTDKSMDVVGEIRQNPKVTASVLENIKDLLHNLQTSDAITGTIHESIQKSLEKTSSGFRDVSAMTPQKSNPQVTTYYGVSAPCFAQKNNKTR